ncbi:MAG: hypothetical protein L0H29_10865, partial [Sinobacteraceae bacterium]|nr:hypothetical protein [Nevskiaceae bacterium]
HVTVPLDRRTDIDTVRDFAQKISQSVADASPGRFTTAHRLNKRRGRVYLDTRRNAFNQTAVAPYSVRGKARAPIATPLDWDELSDNGIGPRRYRVGNIFRRLGQRDCPWVDINQCGQSLDRAYEKLRNR